MKTTHTLEIYKGRKKEWRWRMRALNGKIVADSGEGYKRKGTMMKSFHAFELAMIDGSFEQKEL